MATVLADFAEDGSNFRSKAKLELRDLSKTLIGRHDEAFEIDMPLWN